jgi:hypothetical protein
MREPARLAAVRKTVQEGRGWNHECGEQDNHKGALAKRRLPTVASTFTDGLLDPDDSGHCYGVSVSSAGRPHHETLGVNSPSAGFGFGADANNDLDGDFLEVGITIQLICEVRLRRGHMREIILNSGAR